ncbi:hypothetical protein [Streptomyces sp. NPDC059262]|uniref:hypothetical protein n=1 Tax=Streptomyces sp. NPDC059262 TaxID=3346797 RepID=UPI0036C888DF
MLGVPYGDHEFLQRNSKKIVSAVASPEERRTAHSRNARQHQAFGVVSHHCVGQPLARMELQVLHPILFRRIPTLRTVDDLDAIPFKYDALIYGLHALPVTR